MNGVRRGVVCLALLLVLVAMPALGYSDINAFRALVVQISEAYKSEQFSKVKELLPKALEHTGAPLDEVAYIYNVKGTILKREKAYPEAIEAYEKVVTLYKALGYSEKSPEMLEMLMNVAMAYYSNHNYIKSESMLSSLVQDYKKMPNEDIYRFKVLYTALAYSQYKNDHPDEAAKTAKKGVIYLKAYPHSSPEDWTPLQDVSEQYDRIAVKNVFLDIAAQVEKAKEQNEIEKALILVDTALDENTFNAEDTGWMYHFKGILLDEKKHYTKAIEAYNKSIDFSKQAGFKPDDELIANTMANLVMLYYEIEDYVKVQTILSEKLVLFTKYMGVKDSNIKHFYWALAYSQYQNNQPEEALKTVKKAIDLFVAHDAFINDELHEFKEFQQQFERIVASKDQHYSKILYQKGVQAFWNGNKAEAEEYLTKALNKALGKKGKISELALHIQDLLSQTREFDNEEHYLNYLEKPYRRWHPRTKEIWVYIEPGKLEEGWQPEYTEMVKKAFLDWEEALNHKIKIVFRKKAKPADTYVFWHKKMPPSGLVRKKHNGALTAGKNDSIVRDGVIVQNDIHIYLSHPEWNVTANTLYSTMLHEIGHLLGLAGHSPNPTDIMFSYSANGFHNIMKPSPRDIKTLQLLYKDKTPIMTPRVGHISEYEKKQKRGYTDALFIKNDPMMRFW